MVHLIYLGLPLLLGLSSLVKADCTFNIDNGCVIQGGCTDGYFEKSKKLILVKNSGTASASCEVIDNPIGYFKNQGGLNKFILCTQTGCEIIKEPTDTTCTSTTDGKLIKTVDDNQVKLCTKINKLIDEDEDVNGYPDLDRNHYTTIPFEDGEYLVHHAQDGDVFNFASDRTIVYYAVVTSSNAIAFNPSFSKTDHCATSTGKLVDRPNDFCSDDSSGMYYTCTQGLCSAEFQYDREDQEFQTQTVCDPSDQDTWNNCSIGYYLESKTLYQCAAPVAGGSIECDEQSKDIGYYKGGDGGVIVCKQKSSGSGTECTEVDMLNKSTTTCNEGNVISGTYTLCVVNRSHADDSRNFVLFGKDITEKQFIPAIFLFYGGNENQYYSLAIGESKSVPSARSTTTDNYYFYDSAIILCSSNNALCNSIGEVGYYLINNQLIQCQELTDGQGESRIYCDTLSEPNDGYYINNLSENSKKLIKCETETNDDGQSTHKCTVESSDAPPGYYFSDADTGKLILCGTDGCSEVDESSSGFFYNTNTKDKSFIECQTVEEDITCYKVITPGSCTDGSNESVDNRYKIIIKDNGALKFCNGKNEEALPTSSPKYYVVGNTKNSIDYPKDFMNTSATATENEIIVKVDKYSTEQFVSNVVAPCIDNVNNILKDQCDTGDSKYTCTDESEPCTNESVGACIPNSLNKADQKSCSGYYYINNILYECNGMSGSCYIINEEDPETHEYSNYYIGYVKNNYKSSTHKYVKCTLNGDVNSPDNATFSCIGLSEPTSNTCNNAGELIKKSTGGVYLCIDNQTNNAIQVFTTIDNSSPSRSSNIFIPESVFINTDSTANKYNLLFIDENEIRPIGVEDNGEYLFNKKVMQCTSTNIECNGTVLTGYYINKENDELITCENGECTSAKAEGYFVNQSKRDDASKYILCKSNGCEELEAPDDTTTNCENTGDLVYEDETTVKLCVDSGNAKVIFKPDITQNYYISKSVFNSLAGINEYYILSVGENAVIPTTSTATGNYLFNKKVMICESGKKECRITSNQGYYLDTENNNELLINCSKNSCKSMEDPLLGYFKKGEDSSADGNGKYIKCTDSGCTDEPLQTSTCSNGKLIKDGRIIKLCINDKVSDGITVFSYSSDHYLIQAKTLDSAITDDKKYYLIDVNDDYAKKISTSNNNFGHFIYEKDGKTVIARPGASQCPPDEGSGDNIVKGYTKLTEYERDEEDRKSVV